MFQPSFKALTALTIPVIGISMNRWDNRFMARHSIRCGIAALLFALALPATARAQTQVYVLDEGTVPLSCSGHPCYGPTVHLINAATGHDLARILAAPLGQKGTSVRLSSDGGLLFVTSNSYH